MRRYILSIFVCLAVTAQAVDSEYYSSLDGKSGSELRQALTQLLYEHHVLFAKYNWDFPFDYDSNGFVWDIYTKDCRMPEGIGIGNTCCCDGVNREHVVCQSTFGQGDSKDKIPQYSDRHHLYLVDAHTNSYRNNYSYGECQTSANASHGTCSNSSKHLPDEGNTTCATHSLGWLGSVTTFANLYNENDPKKEKNQLVYEVDDEYKGDIARAILYMVVRYADPIYCRLPDGARYCTSTGGVGKLVDDTLTKPNIYPVTAWINSSTEDKVGHLFSTSLSTNYGLSAYGKALLLKWHRQDPVSQKEIDRNDGVEALQGNRNPFIDYPCLVEYLWGDHPTDAVVLSNLVGSFEEEFSGAGCSNSTTPAIIRPTGSIEIGATSSGTPISRSVTIQGANLTGELSFAVTGTDASLFSLSASTMTQADAAKGTAITITYLPATAGEHNAILRISGGGLSAAEEVSMSASCCAFYAVTLYRNGQAEILNCCGTYVLPTDATETEACEGWEFAGWTTSESVSSTTMPSFVSEVNEATTLYAVYSGKYHKVTSTDDITDGQYLIVYEKDSMAFDGSLATLDNDSNYIFVTMNDDQIAVTDATIHAEFTIAVKQDGYSILSASGIYIGHSGTNNGLKQSKEDKYTNAISISDGNVDIICNTFVMRYNANAGQKRFRYFTATNTPKEIQLYKRSVTYFKTIPCPIYSVTYADEDGIAAGGQYFASPAAGIAGTIISIEAEPNDGYVFEGWEVTQAGGTAAVEVNDGQFEMPAYDVRVSALFSKLPTHTTTWMANGAQVASQSGLLDDETPELPNSPANCSEERVFVGWTSQSNYTDATTAPEDFFTSAAPGITCDTTFYAVYAAKATAIGDEDTTLVMASYQDVSGSFGTFTFSAAKNNGSSSPTYNIINKDARIYAKGSLTISCANTMTGIVFNISTQGKKRLAPITASTGAIATQSSGDITVTWTGSANEVTFTVGENANYGSEGSSKAGQLCFTSVVISRSDAVITTYSNYRLFCSTIPTDIEKTEDNSVGNIRKILYHGQLVILRGDRIYTITGQEIL